MKINGYVVHRAIHRCVIICSVCMYPASSLQDLISSPTHPEEKRRVVTLKYIKITLSSIVVSRLGGSLPKGNRARIVAEELKLVGSAACSSCNIIIRGNIRPH
jgi:hypothetical protein